MVVFSAGDDNLNSNTSGSGHGHDSHCLGTVIDSNDIGMCFCDCTDQEVHLYVPTIIGEVIGIHMTDTAILCYTLFCLIALLIVFQFVYPYLEHAEHIVKNLLKVLKKIPKMGNFLYRFISFVSVPSSGILIVYGCLIGGFLKATKLDVRWKVNELLFFDHEILFLFLIPPLILFTGFYMQKLIFVGNIEIILSHAVFGTMTNMILLGFTLFLVFSSRYDLLDCFVYSSLISAIDPVAVITIFHQKKVNDRIDTLLESESILNDAVAIVMFTLFKNLKVNYTPESNMGIVVALGFAKFFWVVAVAGIVGVACGLLASFLLRFAKYHKHELESYEMLLVFFFALLSYLISESLYSSGIVAIMVSAVVMSQYLKYRLTTANRTAIRNSMQLVCSICEGLIFLYLGIAVVLYMHEWDWGLIFLSNILIFIYRFIIVFAISIVFNLVRVVQQREMIPWKEVFVQAFAGIRGAVSFALVWTIPETIATRNVFVTTTVTVIVLTIFVQSSFISSLVYALKIEKKKLPTEKKVAQFEQMNRYLKKIIICLPVEHSGKSAELDLELKKGGAKTKRLLASNTSHNYHKLQHAVNAAVEIRIGEHAYHHLEETSEWELKDVDEIYLEEPDELEILKELYFFLRENHVLFSFPKTQPLKDEQISEAAMKLHDLVAFKDRLSFLIAKMLQNKYDKAHTEKKEFNKWVYLVWEKIDRAIQWCVNRKGVVKCEKKFIRAYYNYKSFCDLHMFEHIAVNGSEASPPKTPPSDHILSFSSVSKCDAGKIVRSRTFREFAEMRRHERKSDAKKQRFEDIKGEIKSLFQELGDITKFFGVNVSFDAQSQQSEESVHIDLDAPLRSPHSDGENVPTSSSLHFEGSPSITSFSDKFFKDDETKGTKDDEGETLVEILEEKGESEEEAEDPKKVDELVDEKEGEEEKE